MNILLLGSGGRESAFAWKLSLSTKLDCLYIAPGNAGTALYGINLPVSETDFEGVKKAVLDFGIDLVLVGPEAPLVKGIHDYFLADEKLKNVPVLGPKKDGAQLEGSKDFAKQFMQRNNIPTGRYKTFNRETLAEGLVFLESMTPPFVLKADGLAAGKGVVILNSLTGAKEELTEMLTNSKFGPASDKVIIEEFLEGIEMSVFVLTDGTDYKILPSAKDYKRIGEGDKGPNTGGMGAVSPVPFADNEFLNKVEGRIIKPTLDGLKRDRIEYKGFIFIGIMNVAGDPYVIEYNCRMGDPETEVVIPRIKSDLIDLLEGVALGNLNTRHLETDSSYAVTVMLVSGGYPGDYEKGKVINGVGKTTGILLFHSGTMQAGNNLVTSGGRVLAITSMAPTLKAAIGECYKNVRTISYEGKYCRYDIGSDLC